MLKNQILRSMMAEQYEMGGDYLNSFLPFIEYCLYEKIPEKITATTLKESVELLYPFGLTIANYQEIINRFIKLDKLCYVEDGGYYTPVKGLMENGIKERAREFSTAISELAHEYLHFSQTFNKNILFKDAKAALLNFIIKNIDMLIAPDSEDRLSLIHDSEEATLLLSLFLLDVYEQASNGLRNLKTLIRAGMCYHFVYYNKSQSESADLSNLLVFFDTALVIYALGYAGEIRKNMVNELIAQLSEHDAKIYCFEHTLVEIRNILTSCEHLIISNSSGTGAIRYSVEYFVAQPNTITEIGEASINLEQNINKLTSIKVFKEKLYERDNKEFFVDEHILAEKLSKEMGNNDESHTRACFDAQSVNLVNYLRYGTKPLSVPESRALFVTQTRTLEHVATNFLNHKNYETPVVWHYCDLSTWLFACTENKQPDLQLAIILENCYSALAPSDKEWNKYIEDLNKRVEEGKIQEVDYLRLRSMKVVTKAVVHNAVNCSAMILSLDEVIKLDEERKKKEVEEQIEIVKIESKKREEDLKARVDETKKDYEDLLALERTRANSFEAELTAHRENAKAKREKRKTQCVTRVNKWYRIIMVALLLLSLFVTIVSFCVPNELLPPFLRWVGLGVAIISTLMNFVPNLGKVVKGLIINTISKRIDSRYEEISG